MISIGYAKLAACIIDAPDAFMSILEVEARKTWRKFVTKIGTQIALFRGTERNNLAFLILCS